MSSLQITQPLVTVNWLSDHLDHPDLIILDATIKKATSPQESDNFNAKIKNAWFFDIKNDFSDKTNEIPTMLPNPQIFSKSCQQLGISTHHKIVIYDDLGIYSSPRVWWMFKAMGFDNVAVLDGGLPAWQKANLPCVPKDENKKTPSLGNFESKYRPQFIANSKTVLEAIDRTDSITIDARSHGRFIGIAPEPRANLKGGHIPNSINLPYTKVLQDGKMLPVTALKKIYTDLNIDHKKLIFTCGSGITASILLLAAERAGYTDSAVYDGSWSEWGQLEHVPIEC